MELPMPSSIPRDRRSVFVTKRSSPTSCTRLPSLSVNSFQPAQSSSEQPSSMLMIGYLSTHDASKSTNSADVKDLPSPSKWYLPSRKNSVEATSMPRNTSTPGL